MAVQGTGLGKSIDPAMQDQTHFNARSGAAKHPQTNFPIHPGMTDQQRAMSGVSPAIPGTGPDAVSSNPAGSLESRGKKVQTSFEAKWGMKDANGHGVDQNIGGKVLGEAIVSGSAKLPDGESYSTGSPRQP